MAYDEALAKRVRTALAPRGRVAERPMMGGLVFMFEGKMLCAVLEDELMVRVGPAQLPEALAQPHVRVMDFTGRPSKSAVYVEPGGLKTSRAMGGWLDRGIRFLGSQPKKKARRKMR